MIRPGSWTKDYPLLARAVRAAAERLAGMPDWPHVSALKTVLRDVVNDAAVWSTRPARPDEYQKALTTTLALHFALAALVPRKR